MYGNLLKQVKWLINVPKENEINDRLIDSTNFSINLDGKKNLQWKLTHQFCHDKCYFYVSSRHGNIPDDLHLKVTFIILDHSVGKREHFIFSVEKSMEYHDCRFYNNMSIHKEIFKTGSTYVKDGKLHLCVVFGKISSEIQPPMNEIKIDKTFTAMTSNKKSNKKKNEMITLRTADGVELQAFKNFLSEGSIVFQKMFENNMKEKINRIVDVIDFSGKVMTELLRFLYMGKAHLSEEIDMELYEAAKVYQVDGLQDVCLKSIKSRVSDKNVFEILKFALIHDEHLYNFCLEFISFFFPVVDDIRQNVANFGLELQNQVLGDLLSLSVGSSLFCTVVNDSDDDGRSQFKRKFHMIDEWS